jgi:hypothetical protein
MCAYAGGSAPSARRMLICFGVFEMWIAAADHVRDLVEPVFDR